MIMDMIILIIEMMLLDNAVLGSFNTAYPMDCWERSECQYMLAHAKRHAARRNEWYSYVRIERDRSVECDMHAFRRDVIKRHEAIRRAARMVALKASMAAARARTEAIEVAREAAHAAHVKATRKLAKHVRTHGGPTTYGTVTRSMTRMRVGHEDGTRSHWAKAATIARRACKVVY
jgi:hypothetical protein